MIYDAKDFGSKFTQIRKRNGFSIQELALLSSISKSTILDIEQGKRLAKIETLEILSYHLKINMLEVLLLSMDEKSEKLHTITSELRNQLIKHDYSKLDEIKHQLYSLLDTYKYNKDSINDNQYFCNLEQSISWVNGISLSIEGNFEEAENQLLHALSLNNFRFNLKTVTLHNYSTLELYILNSIVANRTRYNYGGRPLKYGREQLEHALHLLGTNSYSQVSKMTGISVSTIYRAKLKLG